MRPHMQCKLQATDARADDLSLPDPADRRWMIVELPLQSVYLASMNYHESRLTQTHFFFSWTRAISLHYLLHLPQFSHASITQIRTVLLPFPLPSHPVVPSLPRSPFIILGSHLHTDRSCSNTLYNRKPLTELFLLSRSPYLGLSRPDQTQHMH
jgi:hypothetical protein